jgi:hypothetical protein
LRLKLELIFLAEPERMPSLNRFRAIDVRGGDRPIVRPPIIEEIVRDDGSVLAGNRKMTWNRGRPRGFDRCVRREVGALPLTLRER